ncbi:protein kinase [Streptomyces lydicus]|uniref:Protein kinase n=1 Tax=Streptomyces lydicus TaxID=47763 RepID=A0A3Q9KBK8_9ACTN|nr:protein kinase [Streptomyces lydicus]
MALLSDPTRSEAVLVGVHDYVNLENLPAVARNLVGLREALTDPALWGLPPEACTVLSQPGSAGQVLDTVRERARTARDTLLVYYAGHGLTDLHTDELYLALPDSDREREYTSLRYEYLRRAVLDPQAGARRTVVILDCCYSGRALLGKMSASEHIADQAIVEGTCLLTASAETRPSLSPPGETYTAFTGELITTLTEGVPDRPDPLDMDTLYRHLRGRLASRSRPVPQQRNRNTGGRIAIARNRAAQEGAVSEGAVPPSLADVERLASRQSEAEKRIAEMERRAELLRVETEVLRQEAERRALQTVETAQRLANALAAAPDREVQPFWFAVPVSRPLMGQDGSLEPAGELVPGIWYLAVEQRGKALVVQTEDGRRGLLLDADGIERGFYVDYGAAGEPGFQPFWFAVPVAREMLSEDGSPEPVAELAPGIWYLAVGQSDGAFVVQTEDGRRGLLFETDGIQHGGSDVAESHARQTLRKAKRLAGAVAASPEPGFQPFWFAVPVAREMVREDGSLEPVAELIPGTWYLAVEQRGPAILAQSADGRRGLLLDTEGIQRG